MSIARIIREKIEEAVRDYDYEEAVMTIVDDLDISDIVNDKIAHAINFELDMESIVRDAIEAEIELEFENFDLEEKITEAIANQI